MSDRRIHSFLESLESRQLLSGTAVLDHGLLTITGTSGNDEIYVINRPGSGQLSVNINMKTQEFAEADVQKIEIDAGAGDDYVGVGGFTGGAVREDVGGGSGVQRSLGAGGERHVSGKTMALRDQPRVVSGKTKALRGEEERIVSGKTKAKRADDVRIVSGKTMARRLTTVTVQRSLDSTPAAAEPGDPPVGTMDSIPATILGGSGNDTLNGSDACDSIDGGAGNDQIIGYAGDDSLTGGAGNDTILGGGGSDLIDGGSGDDLMAGNAFYYYTQVFSRDANGGIASGQSFEVPITADDCTDTIVGGSGADTFHSTDNGEVQDQGAADTVSRQSIPSLDLM
jgi:Ca2+-binding RTX toxin-like protein